MFNTEYPNQSCYVLVQRYEKAYPVIGELIKITPDNKYLVRFDIKSKAEELPMCQILVQRNGDNACKEVEEILNCWQIVKHSIDACNLAMNWGDEK